MPAAALPPVTWAPTAQQRESTQLWGFLSWLRARRGVDLGDYRELWGWSVDDLSGFWDAVREHFDVLGSGFDTPALTAERMPGAEWYPHARLNFARNVLRHADDPRLADRAAIIEVREDDTRVETTWRELARQVAALAATLRSLGVREGDRVGAVLPNLPEAVVGLLATASLGAVWAINSPDLSVDATLSRLQQLEPTVLLGVEGYRFNGKDFDRREHLAAIEAGLPTRRATILVDAYRGGGAAPERIAYADAVSGPGDASFAEVPFDHPLWVLFSSGTTGTPKGIVHGHGGILLEFLKSFRLHQDIRPGDVFYVAANTSWMVWNTLLAALASGASVVCYAGSPMHGRVDRQFRIIADNRVTAFATGAAYLSLVERSGLRPGDEHDLSALRSIMSTASPLPDSTWLWVHDAVGRDVRLGSDSGGTDICSGFIGSNPVEPVHLGHLQGPLLGVAVEAWDEHGHRVVGEVGELVVRRPMPSMPLFFWGDADGSRYHDAYFDRFPGVWVHGDWITETAEGGFIVHGRSDATLNRDGVRLGSADTYAALQHVPGIRDSLVIGVERPGGTYYMPLFVALDDGVALDEALRERIVAEIRSHASARHVPDEIIEVAAVPVTHAGKRVEVQVKKLFAGVDPDRAVSRDALANPDSIDWYIAAARRFREGA